MNKIVDFVLDLHESTGAAKTHYDLRIKYPFRDVLASWALPKAKIPIRVGEKMLAIKTPDHAMYWLTFQGKIPQGQYGAGRITIAQRGVVTINLWSKTMIVFVAEGTPLNGRYSLIRTKFKRGPKQENWILLKARDLS